MRISINHVGIGGGWINLLDLLPFIKLTASQLAYGGVLVKSIALSVGNVGRLVWGRNL